MVKEKSTMTKYPLSKGFIITKTAKISITIGCNIRENFFKTEERDREF
jgi:hypothetical protein